MEEIKKQNVFYEIINHYGIDEQQRMFTEESSELNIALSKLHRYATIAPDKEEHKYYEKLIANVIEEIVDTQIILDQLKYIYAKDSEEELNKLYDFKIKRIFDRVKKEKDYLKNSDDN